MHLVLPLLFALAGGAPSPLAPPLEVVDLDGAAWRTPLTGQVTIVEFFATWCPQCRKSLQGMKALSPELGVRWVLVDVEEEPDVVRTYIERHPVRATVLSDLKGVASRAWGVRGIPAIYVVDERGRVRAAFGGWDQRIPSAIEEIVAKLGSEAKQRPAAPRKEPDQREQPDHREQPLDHDARARSMGVEVIR